MVQPSELDTLVALRILIDILRSDGEFTLPVESNSRKRAVLTVKP